jgi:hypothetical protein
MIGEVTTMSDDPIAQERDRARRSEGDSAEEAVAGTGSGAVPAPARVSQTRDDDPHHDAGDATMGNPPERHDRPTYKSSQLDGSEEEQRER